MTDTPEAVRLADQIHAGNGEWMQKAAALLRRIPGLEAEVQEQARLNGIGAERELALMAQVSRLEAERDQLRAELEKVRWQPIETAPKDGTNIWAYNGEQGVMHWIDVDVVALFVWDDNLLSDADPEPVRPTHWMPLPPPPTSSADSGKGE